MRAGYHRIIFALWLLFAAACGNGQKSGGETVGHLPADSVAVHFWDEPSLFREPIDSAAVEQHFADFLGLLFNVGPDIRVKAVEALMSGARQQELIENYTDHYLSDPNSPLRDDELYILFARQMLESYRLDDAERMVIEARLEEAAKNRPGTRAADFAYISSSGEHGTLHTTAPGREVLLIFYDPDCTHCAEVIERLGNDVGLAQQIDAGRLAVLAVYPDSDVALWRKTAGELPPRWTVARAAEPEMLSELYSIPATPVIYLLDANRRVVGKDVTLVTVGL